MTSQTPALANWPRIAPMKNGRTARLVFAGVAALLRSLVLGLTEVEITSAYDFLDADVPLC